MPASDNSDVSVVISCFNYGRFLRDAINSARQQNGGAPRIIVVDDGSTEAATQALLDELERDTELELIRQENAGASAARNTGLARVETEFALVLDADDMLPPDALKRLVAALSGDPPAGYAYGHIAFFGHQNGVMRMPRWDPWRIMFRHIVGPTALMRMAMVSETGGYDVDFDHYEDWEIWLNGLSHGWSGHQVDFVGLRQRKHGPSKFAGDRARYHEYFAPAQTQALESVWEFVSGQGEVSADGVRTRAVSLGLGARPWPARFEESLYSLLWRANAAGASNRGVTPRIER